MRAGQFAILSQAANVSFLIARARMVLSRKCRGNPRGKTICDTCAVGACNFIARGRACAPMLRLRFFELPSASRTGRRRV
eukprot:664576-Alexandrium_andersonii.AAC.1